MSKTIKGFEGLKYITILNIPIKKINGHEVIGIKMQELERRVAIEIIKHRIPIRGNELSIITSALEISLVNLAMLLGVTKQTIINWRKKRDDRLAPAYEALFRVIASEKLGVDLKPYLSDLLADDEERKIKISAA